MAVVFLVASGGRPPPAGDGREAGHRETAVRGRAASTEAQPPRAPTPDERPPEPNAPPSPVAAPTEDAPPATEKEGVKERAPERTGEAGPAAPEAAPAIDTRAQDDFFAKLRAESEARWARIAKEQAEGRSALDVKFGEVVRRWDPAWSIRDCDDDQCLPAENPCSHLGRENVLATHPLDRGTPCALERTAPIPEGGRTTLVVTVTTADRVGEEDWELRVLVDGSTLGKRAVVRVDGRAEWQTFRFDLTPYGGKSVKLRLENAAGGPGHEWSFEMGCWAEARIESE